MNIDKFFFLGNLFFRKLFSYIPVGPLFINDLYLLINGLFFSKLRKVSFLFFIILSAYILAAYQIFSSVTTYGFNFSDMKYLLVMLYMVFSIRDIRIDNYFLIRCAYAFIFLEILILLIWGRMALDLKFSFIDGSSMYPNNTYFHSAFTLFFLINFINNRQLVNLLFFLASISLLVLEGQRGAYVDLLGASIVYLILIRTWNILLISFLSISFFIAIAIFVNTDFSIWLQSFIPFSEGSSIAEYNSTNTRFEMWLNLLSLFYESADLKTLMFGFGLTTTFFTESFNLHNGYLQIFANYGLIGITIFTLFIAYIFHCTVSILRRKNDSDLLCVFIFLSFIFDALTQTSFDSPFSLTLFYIVCGLIVTKKNNYSS